MPDDLELEQQHHTRLLDHLSPVYYKECCFCLVVFVLDDQDSEQKITQKRPAPLLRPLDFTYVEQAQGRRGSTKRRGSGIFQESRESSYHTWTSSSDFVYGLSFRYWRQIEGLALLQALWYGMIPLSSLKWHREALSPCFRVSGRTKTCRHRLAGAELSRDCQSPRPKADAMC